MNMPVPPSFVADPPSPIRTSVAPWSRAELMSCPTPKLLAARTSRFAQCIRNIDHDTLTIEGVDHGVDGAFTPVCHGHSDAFGPWDDGHDAKAPCTGARERTSPDRGKGWFACQHGSCIVHGKDAHCVSGRLAGARSVRGEYQPWCVQ